MRNAPAAISTSTGAMTGPIDLPPMDAPAKRSVSIDGHRTSVSLEDAFWRALDRIARAQGRTRAMLIADIDHARPAEVGLATALRLFVLDRVQRD